MHCGHADDQHGCVQRYMRRIGGADERARGPVHGEPGERELVHADVQQRVHVVGQQIMLGRHTKQHVCLQRQRMRRDGGDDERRAG